MLLLLVANVAFWAYSQGHLAMLGLAPSDPREPHRLAGQVAPEALVVLNATRPTPDALPTTPLTDPPIPLVVNETDEPSALTPVAPEVPPASGQIGPAGVGTAPTVLPASCWQATGMPRPQEILVRAALENMDGMSGRWSLVEELLPTRWIIYLGPFPNNAALQQRRTELRRANVDHRELDVSSLSPGLALGTYSTQEAARRALADVTRQGVSGARVVQERPDTPLYTLKLEGVTDTQRRQIEAMGILSGRPLQRCP